MEIDNPVPVGVSEITAQGAVLHGEIAVATDDPDVGGTEDATVTAISAAPVLRAEKTATLFVDADGDGVASPGDELLYRIEITNSGNNSATEVALDDAIPLNTALVPGTVQTSQGAVTTEEPVVVSLSEVGAGTTAVVSFRVAIDAPFPFAVTSVSNQGTVTSAELGPQLTDDPSTPAAADATVSEVFITPEVTIDDVAVGEGDGETVTAVFTVSLSVASGREVSLHWATAPLDATSGLDYQSASGILIFTPGETSTEIAVTIRGDDRQETYEQFTVVLSQPSGGVLTDTQGVGTIEDDDVPAVVAGKSDLLLEDEWGDGLANPGEGLRYEITLSNVGTGIAEGVVFSDPLPDVTALVADSVTSTQGEVVVEDPPNDDHVEVWLGELAVGEAAAVTFDVTIANPLPGYQEISNQGLVISQGVADAVTDDPDLPGTEDPTVTPVYGYNYGLRVDFAEGCSVELAPSSGCGECDGKVTELTMEYLGSEIDALIEVKQKSHDTVLFSELVQPGERFSFVGAEHDGTMSTEIKIYVNGEENTKIHTSCSKPIGSGLVSGDFLVVRGRSRHGGPLCPVAGAGGGCAECDGKVTDLTLQYLGTQNDVLIEVVQKAHDTVDRIRLLWPSLNGDLKKIKLDKKTIYDRHLAPPEATIEDGWKGGDKDREIKEGTTEELKLEFDENPQPGGYLPELP